MNELLATLPICGLLIAGAVVIGTVSLAVVRVTEWCWKRSAQLEKGGRE
jgi:hypothetical protein